MPLFSLHVLKNHKNNHKESIRRELKRSTLSYRKYLLPSSEVGWNYTMCMLNEHETSFEKNTVTSAMTNIDFKHSFISACS